MIKSKDEFFDAIRSTFPLDPPLVSNRSWDALSDSLWSGLNDLPEKPILIVWSNSQYMESRSPETYTIASDVFRDLVESLADPEITAGPTKDLIVLRII
ncbi:barstar family protein [Massilia niastensis]|uniref:barstar family protein n=1 Tax=Massilia niastensis TaxID=544911 RepID=UPI003530B0BF